MHLPGIVSAEDKVVRALSNLESLHTRESIGTTEMLRTRTEQDDVQVELEHRSISLPEPVPRQVAFDWPIRL
jgi:hypothetical protein